MPRAFATAQNTNLKPLLAHLDEQKIDYRLIERDDMIELWVADDQLARRIHSAFVQLEAAQKQALTLKNLKQVPITATIMAICIVIAFVTQLGTQYVDPFLIADMIYFPRGWHWELSAEYTLRLFTPMFLHFGIGHIVFNMLGLWYLGQLLERQVGRWTFLTLVMTLALISNVAQLIMSGPLFGGFSGVLYGLIGFAFVYQGLVKSLGVPKGLFVFAGIWLMLGMLGAFSFIGINMANTAHISGVLSGTVLAVLWVQWYKITS